MSMSTRKEVASRIQARGFTSANELLDLDDYEFEQWCGRTAKGEITPSERTWLATNIDLAERWVDGLAGLVDSAETQMEHAEAELDKVRSQFEASGDDNDGDKYFELLDRQSQWKLKVGTFQRKVKRTLRAAERNRARLARLHSSDPLLTARIKELEDAIALHRSRLQASDEWVDEDVDLWKVLGAVEV